MHRLNIFAEIKQNWHTYDSLALGGILIGLIGWIVSLGFGFGNRAVNVIATALILIGFLRLNDTYTKVYRRKYPKPSGNNGLFGD